MVQISMDKIKKIDELAGIIARLKKSGKKIVLCHGVFDLIHPGHIRHFNSAKKLGDILVVTITADKYVRKGPDRPVFNQDLRAEFLANISRIDFVSIIEDDSAVYAIKKIRPDYYVKGPDYRLRKASGIPRKLTLEEKATESVGGKLVFTDDSVIFSSSKLINSYLETYPQETKTYLADFRRKYSPDYIGEKLNSLAGLKALVIGDAIIDQYHYCIPMGKSSKEPVIVHKYVRQESFTGGAVMAANHMASLVKEICLVSVLGQVNSFENFILKHLKKEVSPRFFTDMDVETVIKRRFLDAYTNQKLFQMSFLKDNVIPHQLEKKISGFLKSNLEDFDLVLVNDFGHGLLTEKLIRLIVKKAKFVALNVQANSANYGFNTITKYPRADFVCIDGHEIRLALHDKYSDLKYLIKKICKKMKCRNIIVTRGPEGTISYSEKEGFLSSPALTQRVVDRVGAGDALFALSSPCIYAGFGNELTSFIGNMAGALQVQTIGNRQSIEFSDLIRFMGRLLK